MTKKTGRVGEIDEKKSAEWIPGGKQTLSSFY
jgi:hypothetical protein